jgi:hypothetical protein
MPSKPDSGDEELTKASTVHKRCEVVLKAFIIAFCLTF